MLNFRTWIISAVFLFSNLAIADSKPKVFDNEYKTKLYGFNIVVTNRLTQLNDNEYQLLFKFDSMLGSITETSKMLWNNEKNTVVPQHYVYKRRGLGKDRDADLRFDWNKKVVANHVQKSQWQMDIVEKVQDKLSYQLQLQQDFISGKEKFSYKIADGGHLKEYKFEKVGEEILETPLGKVNAVKVKRSRDNDERITYAWLAKDWNYLLVRLQQEEKGDAYTIYITKASLDGKPITQF